MYPVAVRFPTDAPCLLFGIACASWGPADRGAASSAAPSPGDGPPAASHLSAPAPAPAGSASPRPPRPHGVRVMAVPLAPGAPPALLVSRDGTLAAFRPLADGTQQLLWSA